MPITPAKLRAADTGGWWSAVSGDGALAPSGDTRANTAGREHEAPDNAAPQPEAGSPAQGNAATTAGPAGSQATSVASLPSGAATDPPAGGSDTHAGDADPAAAVTSEAEHGERAPAASNAPFDGEDAPVAPTRRAAPILAGLLAAAVVLALAGLLWWRLVPDAPPPPPLPTPGPAVASATTFEDAVAIAQAQADRWLPGARLLNATMQVDWPWRVPGGRVTDLPATGWVTAVFLAPWDAPPGRNETAASLSVVLERLSRQIVLQESLGWETAALPAATPTPGLDSTVASILAERAGGTEFRRACPEVRHLSRIGLVSNAPGFPQHWLVTYEDSRRPELHGLLLRIDAATGDVVDRVQDAPPCPGTEPTE